MNPTLYGWAPSGALPTREQIRTYQVALGLRGFGPTAMSAIDGLMGPTTATSLRAFQSANFLPVTGTFDAATVDALVREVDSLNASGRRVFELARQAADQNAPSASRPVARVTGTHPPVTNIVSQGGVVAVPAKVSQMISPAVESQLKAMPAAQVQSFVNDLSTKADMAESTGTGKASIDAVPVVSPNGTVTAATAITAATGWAALSTTEQVAVGVGAVAVAGLLVYLVARK